MWCRCIAAVLVCAQLGAADLARELIAAAKARNEQRIIELARQTGENPSTALIKTLLGIGVEAPGMPSYNAVRAALAGVRSDRAIEALGEQAQRAKDFRLCMLALYALTDIPGEKTIEQLLPLLRHRNLDVLLTATGALAGKAHASSVSGLIDALGRTRPATGEAALAIRRALYQLTAQNLASPQDWSKWWATVKDTWTPPTGGRERGRTAMAEVKPPGDIPRFFGVEIAAVRVVFIIDVSGSMEAMDPGYNRTRIDLVKDELKNAIKGLRSDTRFTVVSFSDRIGAHTDKLMPVTPKTQAQALAYVDSLRAEGHTWTQEALEKAFTYTDANTFVFLSDGSPFKNGQLLPTQPILDAVMHANRFRRVIIHSISFPGANVPFMRELALQTGGTYQNVGQVEPKM